VRWPGLWAHRRPAQPCHQDGKKKEIELFGEADMVRQGGTGRNQAAILLVLIALGVFLGGCKSDPNNEFVQGTWYQNDPHLAGIDGEQQLESWWTFRQGIMGTFEHYACCFVEIQRSGNYAILESDGENLVLELFNIKGHASRMSIAPGTTVEVRIKIDRQADTIEIDRAGPFIRTGP
jgi:hypothetical protein